MQIIFLGVQYPKIMLKSPIWSDLHIQNPASLRTQENNFGSKYVKNISRFLQTSGHRKVMFMGGSSLEHICTSNPRKKMPHDYLRGYGSLHDSKRLRLSCYSSVWGGMVLQLGAASARWRLNGPTGCYNGERQRKNNSWGFGGTIRSRKWGNTTGEPQRESDEKWEMSLL